jgi:hypothetical protein
MSVPTDTSTYSCITLNTIQISAHKITKNLEITASLLQYHVTCGLSKCPGTSEYFFLQIQG